MAGASRLGLGLVGLLLAGRRGRLLLAKLVELLEETFERGLLAAFELCQASLKTTDDANEVLVLRLQDLRYLAESFGVVFGLQVHADPTDHIGSSMAIVW